MRKIAIILSIVLLLVSCNPLPTDTTVVNNSNYIVSFQRIQDKRIETLNPNASTSIKYFHTSIIILQPEKRIKQERDDNIITLIDLPSWKVYVENKTENTITLAANGWMDEMIVPAGNFTDLPSQKGMIYTNKPQFSVVSDTFPYDVKWQFIDNIFYVVIRY